MHRGSKPHAFDAYALNWELKPQPGAGAMAYALETLQLIPRTLAGAGYSPQRVIPIGERPMIARYTPLTQKLPDPVGQMMLQPLTPQQGYGTVR